MTDDEFVVKMNDSNTTFEERMELLKPLADKTRETFDAIKELRKTPARTRAEKDALETNIKQLQEQWWTDVKPKFRKAVNENNTKKTQ